MNTFRSILQDFFLFKILPTKVSNPPPPLSVKNVQTEAQKSFTKCSRGYRAGSVAAAVERARGLSREVALRKVARTTNQRPVFCLAYDSGLRGVAAILRKRHRALLARYVDTREYLPEPPLVTYTRTNNIRDLVFRAQVPRIQRQGLRGRPPGFYKCGRRT